ncbi:F0F1 ATP synthase subunit B [Candidatus Gottesmanbacteria bacterium]|nr:F0F1 ATP synthase subunit B [Candidatus Gottesmanbacteria bacterium]
MEKLGIEPLQLLTQVFNFLLLVFVLKKLLYKPILKGLDERKKKIQEGLEYTQKMQEEAEKTEKKREEIISKAKDEARIIIEDGKKVGKKVESEITGKAHLEANAILAKGREELEMERQQMERELRVQTIEIAKSWVEAVLGKILSSKTQTAIINKKIQELANNK